MLGTAAEIVPTDCAPEPSGRKRQRQGHPRRYSEMTPEEQEIVNDFGTKLLHKRYDEAAEKYDHHEAVEYGEPVDLVLEKGVVEIPVEAVLKRFGRLYPRDGVGELDLLPLDDLHNEVHEHQGWGRHG